MDHAVEFSYGDTLGAPTRSTQLPVETLRGVAKWTKFPQATATNKVFISHGENKAFAADVGVKLSDLFQIKRGLATGNNDFFILTPEKINKHSLPERLAGCSPMSCQGRRHQPRYVAAWGRLISTSSGWRRPRQRSAS